MNLKSGLAIQPGNRSTATDVHKGQQCQRTKGKKEHENYYLFSRKTINL